MAAGLGLEPSHPVLETSALANILTRIIVFVCPKRQASISALPRNQRKTHQIGVYGRGDGTRTHTAFQPTNFKSVAATYYATPPFMRPKTRIFTEDATSYRSL